MKEDHIQIGSKEIFRKNLERIGVENRESESPMESIYGLKVIVNKLIPEDKAILVDKNGKVLQIFNLSN